MKEYEKQFKQYMKQGKIIKSKEIFKIKLFLKKGENSILIAKHIKNITPTEEQPKKLHWNYWAITISYYSML